VKKHDLSTLRVLGSVGEPVNPEAWRWYHDVVGARRCAVVDTFWQTETGGHMITSLPGAHAAKPGSASFPFFGVDIAILDKDGRELTGNDVAGVVCVRTPWPSIARTIYGDHGRYLDTYMRPFPGFYFTGDGGVRDADGYIWITGRVDDVLNVSGHRLGSAELESALVLHAKVAEAAVIGFPHDTKGEGICCYVTLKEGVPESAEVAGELKAQVRKVIGPFATPDFVILTAALPKTRSGKIMRRVLRKIIAQQSDQLGDITTLADTSVVHELIEKVAAALAPGASK
jgi:acetyl-CoA synthetase